VRNSNHGLCAVPAMTSLTLTQEQKKKGTFNTSNYGHLSSALLLDPTTERAVGMTLVVTSREVTAVSELHQAAPYVTDRAFMCRNGDCPRNVLRLTTTWTCNCAYPNSSNDAPHFSITNARSAFLHLRRSVAGLSPWTRCPGFLPFSIHLGFMVDRWPGSFPCQSI
jgi:hypothetical protein